MEVSEKRQWMGLQPGAHDRGNRQREHQHVKETLNNFRGEIHPPRHPGRIRSPMNRSPQEPESHEQEYREAERFMELAVGTHRAGVHTRLAAAGPIDECDENENAGDPMERLSHRAVASNALCRHRTLRIGPACSITTPNAGLLHGSDGASTCETAAHRTARRGPNPCSNAGGRASTFPWRTFSSPTLVVRP